MKKLWNDIVKIKSLLSDKPLITIFLDFDGTISPIVSTPDKAKMAPKINRLLKILSVTPRILLVIVSGRSLDDLRKKIPLKIINLAANHGLEWVINGEYNHVPLKIKYLQSLRSVKLSIKKLTELLPDIIIEDKKLSLAIHYRLLNNHQTKIFKEKFRLIIKRYIDANLLEVIDGKKVFDIRPAINWTKGSFSKLIVDEITMKGIKPLTICIGDDETDEDMFKMFDKGITIRIGKNNNSKGKYYVSKISDIIEFLQLIIESSMV